MSTSASSPCAATLASADPLNVLRRAHDTEEGVADPQVIARLAPAPRVSLHFLAAAASPSISDPSSSRSSPQKDSRASLASPTKKQKKKVQPNRPFASPQVYAHLPTLTDHISLHNSVLLVGINPGVASAKHGHAYAGPTNIFWKLVSPFSSSLPVPFTGRRSRRSSATSCTSQASRRRSFPSQRTRSPPAAVRV